MKTKFGTFPVESTDLLKVRVHEVGAAVQLEEKSGTGTMLKSAGQTAMKPIDRFLDRGWYRKARTGL
jgi:hypothetical protein